MKILSLTGFGIDPVKIGQQVGDIDPQMLGVIPRVRGNKRQEAELRTFKGVGRSSRVNSLNLCASQLQRTPTISAQVKE